MRQPIIGLVVGDIAVGKTTVCRRVAERIRQRGQRVGGIITRPLYDGQGCKRGLAVCDLWSGEARLLASVGQSEGALVSLPGFRGGQVSQFPRPRGEEGRVRGNSDFQARASPGPLYQGPYTFDPAAFAWAVEAVRTALSQAPDLIIVDEIGPLELERGAGFAPLLGLLTRGAVPLLLVVRWSCRQALEARLGCEALAFVVDVATRDALPEAILEAMSCRFQHPGVT